MLRRIRLQNFRRFTDHVIPFRRETILVGPNNAGKSTVVEAVRLISLVANRFENLPYQPAPTWLDEPAGIRGVSPALRDLNTDLTSVFHAYGEPPALVEATFDNGASIRAYVGPDSEVFAVVVDQSGRVITSKSQARGVRVPGIAIQPQVGPVAREERLLDERTVLTGLGSPLAPRHFRNQLHYLGGKARAPFESLAEQTWPGLQLRGLHGGTRETDEVLSLLIRDGNFVGELALMGHGLQMWLQVVWFLSRSRDAPTVVLDEPDVYLHADLQRKLIRLLRELQSQVIVATHSIEMISEADPSSILVINPDREQSGWVEDLKGAQEVIDKVGGVHNIQLARLASARRALFVEGPGDVPLLRRLLDVVDPEADSLQSLPNLEVGGWGGWERVVGAAEVLRNSSGDSIQSYAIFDSDFHDPEEVVERYTKADDIGLQLHVWRRKELENYLLVPSCIHRLIINKVDSGKPVPAEDDVVAALETVAHELLEQATEECASQYMQRHRGTTVATAMRWSRNYRDRRLAEDDGLVGFVSGKRALSAMSAWSQTSFGVAFGASTVAREIETWEVPEEMTGVLGSISRFLPFETEVEFWTSRQ